MLATTRQIAPSGSMSPLYTSTSPRPDGTHLDMSSVDVASQILAVINRYQLGEHRHSTRSTDGNLKFLAQIYGFVKTNQPLKLCLPAFPFKSPNERDKVLGHLPDKAEEFALAHLNGLCLALEEVYAPGANLRIISDGLVYNGSFNKFLALLVSQYVVAGLTSTCRSTRCTGQKCLGIW